MWKWLAKLMLNAAEGGVNKVIDRELPKLEDDIQDIIDRNTDPDAIANSVVDYVIVNLKKVVGKVFGWVKKILGGTKVRDYLFAEIDGLEKFKPAIALLVGQIDAAALASQIIAKVQSEAKKLSKSLFDRLRNALETTNSLVLPPQ